jgi:hypothetical protein
MHTRLRDNDNGRNRAVKPNMILAEMYNVFISGTDYFVGRKEERVK